MNYRLALPIMALPVMLLAACASHVAKCTSPEDNPQHHYLVGMEALEKKNLDQAQEKFDRMLYCEEDNSKAFSGLAMVAAGKSRSQADSGYKGVDTGRAFDNLKKADKYASKQEEKFDFATATIRVESTIKSSDWLDRATDAYKTGSGLTPDDRLMPYYQGKEALTYFMGVAYLEGLEFAKARDSFSAVLNSKREGKWHEKADKGWNKTDKIVRAMAGVTVGDVGKKIAIKESVTRGDLAALLIDEMKIEKVLAGRIPVESQVDAMKAEFTPADIMNSPFKQEIMTILKWKVRGLEPKYDETTMANLFKPSESVKRGEMAFILEDVLIKLTGDEKIATAYFGQDRSPFPDVRATSPLFNAVMNMTTRGIMEGELSGEFRVNAPVDGPEALLAIRMLRQKLNTY
ncbi:MAG: S-layer homology domain-containing protein [Geobacter sp.]|nr:S-layer homology domain-containing protein [Geobacter sp.]